MTTYSFGTAEELDSAIKRVIISTKSVLDIGCGIRPVTYFAPNLLTLVEPWEEYCQILKLRFEDNPGVIVFNQDAQTFLKSCMNDQYDSIFALDVIEHLKKEDGYDFISQISRVSRNQVVIFTPLGFFEQTHGVEEKDGWGLNGSMLQNHLSGWTPEDFGENWNFYICETYHKVNHRGEKLANPQGAFYAVLNKMYNPVKPVIQKIELVNLFDQERKQIVSETNLQELEHRLSHMTNELKTLAQERSELLAERDQLKGERSELLAERDQLSLDKAFFLKEMNRLKTKIVIRRRDLESLIVRFWND